MGSEPRHDDGCRGGIVVLQPKITSGSATVTLGTPTSDSGITVAVSQPTLSKGHNGKITVTAGTTPGFYHFSVPSTDTSGVTQQQGGYILVGNPPASFTKTGDKQKGAAGSQLTLSVTLDPGQSGGSASGRNGFFTTSAGSLSSRIVDHGLNGKASVMLTLPSTGGNRARHCRRPVWAWTSASHVHRNRAVEPMFVVSWRFAHNLGISNRAQFASGRRGPAEHKAQPTDLRLGRIVRLLMDHATVVVSGTKIAQEISSTARKCGG